MAVNNPSALALPADAEKLLRGAVNQGMAWWEWGESTSF